MTRFAILAFPVIIGLGAVSSTSFAGTGNTEATESKVDSEFYQLFTQLKASTDSITGSARIGDCTVKSTVSGSGMSVDVLDSRGTTVGTYRLATDGKVTQSGEMKSANLSVIHETSAAAKKFQIIIDCGNGILLIRITTNRGTFTAKFEPVQFCA